MMVWYALCISLVLLAGHANAFLGNCQCTTTMCPRLMSFRCTVSCPPNLTPIAVPGRSPDSCYGTPLGAFTFLEAAEQCLNLGANLVEFENGAELTAVTAGLQPNREYIIGYTNAYNAIGDNTFGGLTTGNPISVPDGVALPPVGAGGCLYYTVQLVNGKPTLGIQTCLTKIHDGGYICERDISSLTARCG